ncbi:putative hydrolase of the HAD superfamily [Arthrobacter stackebrandtii]|uniref:Hydrolase of the HAD superfamily n=1 Tax=Arthrobacter stackebrandtii TaxID=272161 RepID=A0ABS4YYY2_9MICC|nr:HAD family hydrolase [Arthrobacter stackebrandtii]MBP2414011.1 putative hydrolase of the HAD superfamily [Arthrobacter stackebrandtii]
MFDIDETIVDLYKAMADAMVAASAHLLPGHGDADWEQFAAIYMADAEDYYDRYVAGEFTFNEQRGLRARAVFARLGVPFGADAEEQWIEDFERAQPLSIRAFEDVVPVLDALDAAGIAYGAVSNNVHDYQRAKLDQAGLQRISVLVGIDTVGVSKPAPEIFLEGCRQIGLAPGEVLYVGDNFMVDGVGSVQAGLHGMWLNRLGQEVPAFGGGSSLGGGASAGGEAAAADAAAQVAVVSSLAEIPVLLGLSEPAKQV